uniref:Uncharacterized protein n=1 Tax=Lepeophtheirus salmonis TaxID=72036 RepID=A0A0K2UGS2_LEPSM
MLKSPEVSTIMSTICFYPCGR